MIRVRHRFGGNLHSLVVVGHADHSEHGNDIVCAGTSAIVYSLLGWLENHKHELPFLIRHERSGEALIFCRGGGEADTAFQMAVIGLAQIAQKYPDHVAVEIIPH